jgi:hypothetical protein
LWVEREEDIRKIRDRMEAQGKGREREIALTTEKIGQAQLELKNLTKKSTINDTDRL